MQEPAQERLAGRAIGPEWIVKKRPNERQSRAPPVDLRPAMEPGADQPAGEVNQFAFVFVARAEFARPTSRAGAPADALADERPVSSALGSRADAGATGLGWHHSRKQINRECFELGS